MDDWENPVMFCYLKKKILNMEDITNADKIHAKRVFKDFKMKKNSRIV